MSELIFYGVKVKHSVELDTAAFKETKFSDLKIPKLTEHFKKINGILFTDILHFPFTIKRIQPG